MNYLRSTQLCENTRTTQHPAETHNDPPTNLRLRAVSSGLTNNMLAPVVPITEAKSDPTINKKVLVRAEPESFADIKMPPVMTKSEPSKIMKLTNSSIVDNTVGP